jgi:hypothetical protein
MKTSFQKQSFGGGFGINRNTGGARSLPTAVPPLAHVTVRPGSGFSRSDTGKSGKKHSMGAKVIGAKK